VKSPQYRVPSCQSFGTGNFFGRAICSNVPTGTFHFAENLWRKWLIPRAEFWADQWIQGVRMWKKCPLSRVSDDYESRLDFRVMYFIRYAGGGGAGLVPGASTVSLSARSWGSALPKPIGEIASSRSSICRVVNFSIAVSRSQLVELAAVSLL